jgi:hypothetical protein
MVEWIALLLDIQEILGVNFGLVTGYPESFRGIFQFLLENPGTAA